MEGVFLGEDFKFYDEITDVMVIEDIIAYGLSVRKLSKCCLLLPICGLTVKVSSVLCVRCETQLMVYV